jgi:hypothetical protein
VYQEELQDGQALDELRKLTKSGVVTLVTATRHCGRQSRRGAGNAARSVTNVLICVQIPATNSVQGKLRLGFRK